MTNAQSNPLTDFVLGDFLVVLHLNAKPEFSGCLEILGERDCGLGRNATTLMNNVSYTRCRKTKSVARAFALSA